jgi:ketosteroid isomerase-like protein
MSSLLASPRIRVALLAAGLLIFATATVLAAEEPRGESAARIAKVEDAIWNRAEIEMLDWRGMHRRSGKKLEVSGCVVYHVKEGKIVEAWNY